MSRVIKFRYWNTITNQMVNEPQMPHKEGWTITQLFSERGWVWQQFTGLTDKNGVDLYEGDIISGYNGIAVIRYDSNPEAGGGFYPDFVNDVDGDCNDWWQDKQRWHRFEVVGNIYQDSHLLELKNDH